MTYTYENVSQSKIDSWKIAIQNAGWQINSSRFSISWVEWKYEYNNWTLTIEITDKPWLASWGMIEDKLDSYFW